MDQRMGGVLGDNKGEGVKVEQLAGTEAWRCRYAIMHIIRSFGGAEESVAKDDTERYEV